MEQIGVATRLFQDIVDLDVCFIIMVYAMLFFGIFCVNRVRSPVAYSDDNVFFGGMTMLSSILLGYLRTFHFFPL